MAFMAAYNTDTAPGLPVHMLAHERTQANASIQLLDHHIVRQISNKVFLTNLMYSNPATSSFIDTGRLQLGSIQGV